MNNCKSDLIQCSQLGWRRLLEIPSRTCLTIAIALSATPVSAQITQATIQEILDGDRVFIEQTQTNVGDVASFGETVSTEDSRTELTFSNLAAGRLGFNSSVVVGQCVEVRDGQLLASGPVNGCVAGFTANVQGTIYIMSDEDEGTFQVLFGQIEVVAEDGTTLTIPQARQVSVEDGRLGEVEIIPPDEYIDILEGPLFEGYATPLPDSERLVEVCRELRRDAAGTSDRECPAQVGVTRDVSPVEVETETVETETVEIETIETETVKPDRSWPLLW